MTTISRERFEYICKAMVERMTGPKPRFTGENEVNIRTKRVEATAEQKALLLKNQATVAAADANFEIFQRESGERRDRAFYAEATYTKFGKMSASDKDAYVQQKLAQFDNAEAIAEKRRQEIEKDGLSAPTTEQTGNASPLGSSAVNHFRYEESREMYLPNVSDLSLEHSKKALFFVESAIKNHEDLGMNVHGHYGKQSISDLNAYLAALKDHISKIGISATSTTSEPASGSSSNVE